MTIREMIERRVKASEESKAILEAAKKDKRNTLNGEEQVKFDALHAEISELRDKIAAEEQATQEQRTREDQQARLESELAESRGRQTTSVVAAVPAAGGEGIARASYYERTLAFRAWAGGADRATRAMVEAAGKVGVDFRSAYIDMARFRTFDGKGEGRDVFLPVRTDGGHNIEVRSEAERRELSVGTVTAGGDAVGNEVIRAYFDVQKWYGAVRGLAEVIQTETGATLPYPTVDDTGNTGANLAEGVTAATTADPLFGVKNLGAYLTTSNAVLVSWQLIQDIFFPIEEYLGRKLGTRVARLQNTKFTTGAGTTEQAGVVTGAVAGVTSAVTNVMEPDDIISLIHSLDPAYRSLPGTGFMMHDSILAVVRQFKDGQFRYLWEPSLQVGQPDRLYGYPVTPNNDMASAVTTSAKVMLFGNIRLGFVIRDAGSVRFQRLSELYGLQHQVAFEASQRSDSIVVGASALKLYAMGA